MNRAELAAFSTEALLDGFSDCYKCIYDVRPRFEPSREFLLDFWATYDSRLAEIIERDREEAETWAAIDAAEAAAEAEADEMRAIASGAERAYEMGVPLQMLEGWV